MRQNQVNELKQKGTAVQSVDNKNKQERQVIVTSGKIRIQVSKGVERGQTKR
jgi:hypothetical protein